MNNELNIPVADVLMLVPFQAMVIQKVGDQLYIILTIPEAIHCMI